jgi:hypothetical protein
MLIMCYKYTIYCGNVVWLHNLFLNLCRVLFCSLQLSSWLMSSPSHCPLKHELTNPLLSKNRLVTLHLESLTPASLNKSSTTRPKPAPLITSPSYRPSPSTFTLPPPTSSTSSPTSTTATSAKNFSTSPSKSADTT